MFIILFLEFVRQFQFDYKRNIYSSVQLNYSWMIVSISRVNFGLQSRGLLPCIRRLMSSPAVDKPVESGIRQKLTDQLAPIHLTVINESHMHNVPRGAETHFKVLVVSEKFEKLPLIKRHRMVNEILEHELKTGVHALSIMAKTPSQWDEKDTIVPPSPACRGGFGK